MTYNLENLFLRIMDITHSSAVDGEGFRDTLFVNYCPHHCPGCHNPQSWDFKAGQEMSVQELLDIIKDDEFANVTYSGGDPLYQVEAFTELSRRVKEETNKTIWCYTGFTYEEVLADERLSMILPYLDALVEGPYIQELRNTDLPFRGSSNQRIIELKK